jgi:hypothetical protein
MYSSDKQCPMNIFDKLYLRLFGVKLLRKANDKILKLALKVRGFNNFEDHRVSGEQHLVDSVLKQLATKERCR